MALDTYADLVATVADWLDDSSLTAQADTFIRLAEARFNRVLRTVDMETAAIVSVSAETAPLPANFAEMRAIWAEGSPDKPLEQTSLVNLKSQYAMTGAFLQAYAVAGSDMWFAPVGTATVNLTAIYYRSIPALSGANTTNWLLKAHPDAYLLGCLVAAELRGWTDERLPLLKSALDEMLVEINDASTKKRFGGAPLVAKMAPRQVAGVRI